MSEEKGSTETAQKQKRNFNFSFASAGKVTKVIKKLSSTESLGIDGIPVSVLKKGIDELTSPISHLINMSFSSGRVPTGFKMAKVIPIYKEKGKKCLILHLTGL